jgi:hypothetical protein
MLKKIKNKIYQLLKLPNEVKELQRRIDILQRSIGRIELRQTISQSYDDVQAHEFQVYSQWGEDGIIQSLLRSVPIVHECFVEFGVEDYRESNTRFLLQNNNWRGLIIDSSSKFTQLIRQDDIHWRHDLKVACQFITRENINDILLSNQVTGDIGLLSIDLDGNDYWVWKAITAISPRIVVCEYNSLFGYRRKVTIPYDHNFVRHDIHHSGCYYGASISALVHLADEKGYALIGSNSTGLNLFFVRKDVIGELKKRSIEEVYFQARFRDSRDEAGNLTYLDFDRRLRQILHLPLYDIDLRKQISVKDLSDIL